MGLLYVLLHSKKSLCCTCFRFVDLRLEEQSGPTGRTDEDHEVKSFLDTPPPLLDNLKEAGGDIVVEGKMAEVWQLHKHQDNMSRVRGTFLMRPRSSYLMCLAFLLPMELYIVSSVFSVELRW